MGLQNQTELGFDSKCILSRKTWEGRERGDRVYGYQMRHLMDSAMKPLPDAVYSLIPSFLKIDP